MDFLSLHEFPPLTQVMSPSGAAENKGEWGEAMAAAYMAGAGAASSAAQPEERRFPWESGNTADAGKEAVKNRLSFRSLDTGRAQDYDSWRHAAKAEIVASASEPGRAIGYLTAIEQPHIYSDDELYRAVQNDDGLRALDARVYGAILEALQGGMRAIVEARIRAQGHPYAGGLALRRLDAFFQAGAQRRKAVATRELLVLAPRGQGAVSMEEFLATYRLLLQQAGVDNVGSDAQVDILRRAAEDHPRLSSVWAAWQHGGGRDPNRLLECLEDATARGVHSQPGPRQAATAWAASESAPEGWRAETTQPGAPQNEAGGEPTEQVARQWTRNYAAKGYAARGAERPAPTEAISRRRDDPRKCFNCGKPGHLQRDCRGTERQQRHGAAPADADPQKELLKTMNSLLAELRATRTNESVRKSKNE